MMVGLRPQRSEVRAPIAEPNGAPSPITSANPAELDAIVTALEHDPLIKSATWTVSTES